MARPRTRRCGNKLRSRSIVARPSTRRWENLPHRAAWRCGCEAGGEQCIHELLSGCRSGISSSSRRRRAGMYGCREWEREREREAMVSTQTLARMPRKPLSLREKTVAWPQCKHTCVAPSPRYPTPLPQTWCASMIRGWRGVWRCGGVCV